MRKWSREVTLDTHGRRQSQRRHRLPTRGRARFECRRSRLFFEREARFRVTPLHPRVHSMPGRSGALGADVRSVSRGGGERVACDSFRSICAPYTLVQPCSSPNIWSTTASATPLLGVATRVGCVEERHGASALSAEVDKKGSAVPAEYRKNRGKNALPMPPLECASQVVGRDDVIMIAHKSEIVTADDVTFITQTRV